MSSDIGRDDSGEFTPTVSEQEILKIFDAADVPVLTASEIAQKLPVTRRAINHRLTKMHERGLVERKKVGSRAVVWWATVAPRLSEEIERRLDETSGERERGETVSHDDLKRELGIE